MKLINSFIQLKSGFVIISIFSFTLIFGQPKQKTDLPINIKDFPEYSEIKSDTIFLRPEEVLDVETILGIFGMSGSKVSSNIKFAVKNDLIISWDSKEEKNSVSKVTSLCSKNYRTISYSVIIPVNRLSNGQWESVGKKIIEYWEGNNGPKQYAVTFFPCRIQPIKNQ